MIKSIKNVLLFNILLVISCTSFAQKQTFDVVSYTLPKGWQQQKNEAGIQLSITDKKTGAYAVVVLTKSMASSATADENFNNDWLKLVKGAVQVNSEPAIQKPTKENGWDVMSGNANYIDGTNTGVATLLTATGGNKAVSVVLMTNTKQYQNDLSAFITSLELSEPLKNNSNGNQLAFSAKGTINSSIAGVWSNNLLETSGYANGFPQYTAGYFRKEYTFKSDGTYFYSQKNWSATSKIISYAYETGTWLVNGNSLTLLALEGRAGEWNRTSSNKEWGNLIKTKNWKLEKTTYRFERKYYSGSQNTTLLLDNGNTTERDGTYTNQRFSYTLNEEPLIDFPPGFKISVTKPSSANAQQINSNQLISNLALPFVNKIWEGTSLEKFTGAGAMTGHYTGGFSTSQYKFNADGTYRFVNVLASHYTDTKTLEYETGNWSINGDQLSISPVKGQNEEWSKVGKTSNGNSDVTNRAINETWGKKMKTSSRKLEKYTYAFSIEKNGDKTALVLQRNGRTEREGEGKRSYFNETSFEGSVKLPPEVK